MAITLVSTITVPSVGQTTSIEFANIPQTGKDLLLLASVRDNAARFYLTVNGGADTAFSFNRLLGDGSSASAFTSTRVITSTNSTSTTSDTFGNAAIRIGNYTSSVSKPILVDAVTENNGSAAVQLLASATTNTTSAITTLTAMDPIFSAGTKLSLYIIS